MERLTVSIKIDSAWQRRGNPYTRGVIGARVLENLGVSPQLDPSSNPRLALPSISAGVFDVFGLKICDGFGPGT